MRFTLKHWLMGAVVGAVLLAVATPASAQYMYRPNGPYGPVGPYGISNGPGYPAYNPAILTSAPVAPVVPNPYVPSGTQATLSTMATPDPFYNPTVANPYSSYYNPVGGYLSGKADLVTARANSTVTYQKSLLVQEEVFRSQLDTRRKIWEEARYERASLMNSEQMRLLDLRNALDRARNSPPANEIWSAQSLNDLFNYLSKQQGMGVKGPKIDLNEDVLKRINLTTGKDGNVGLLKSEIRWPIVLQRPEFDEPRKKLEDQLAEAKRQAQVGPVSANLASDVQTNVRIMQDRLLSSINQVAPSDYIVAKNYLKMLDDSARALNDPNINDYFNGKWSAKGKTVEELVKHVTEKGLKFAPAAPGDEAAYTALYRAMRDYDASMTQLLAHP